MGEAERHRGTENIKEIGMQHRDPCINASKGTSTGIYLVSPELLSVRPSELLLS